MNANDDDILLPIEYFLYMFGTGGNVTPSNILLQMTGAALNKMAGSNLLQMETP